MHTAAGTRGVVPPRSGLNGAAERRRARDGPSGTRTGTRSTKGSEVRAPAGPGVPRRAPLTVRAGDCPARPGGGGGIGQGRWWARPFRPGPPPPARSATRRSGHGGGVEHRGPAPAGLVGGPGETGGAVLGRRGGRGCGGEERRLLRAWRAADGGSGRRSSVAGCPAPRGGSCPERVGVR